MLAGIQHVDDDKRLSRLHALTSVLVGERNNMPRVDPDELVFTGSLQFYHRDLIAGYVADFLFEFRSADLDLIFFLSTVRMMVMPPDIGFTIPGQSWTYWNKGPGPGEDYSETEEGHEWSHQTGRAAAANLLAVARALADKPMAAPPG